MGRPVIDLTGQRHGIMSVLRRDEAAPGGRGEPSRWIVRCDCGTERSIRSDVLRIHKQKSCGCLRGNGGHFQVRYGIPKAALQRWTNMMRRCFDPKSDKDRRNYMDRGITVCARWRDPLVFYADIGDQPFEGATLDRIDNNGNYEPSNCRWATYSQQNNNRRPMRRREISHRHVE